jgi:hypothetical protein
LALDPKLIAEAFAPQIVLSQNESGRLSNRIREDFFNSLTDHDARMRRFQRYYQRWRARTDMPPIGEADESDFRVPITQWQTYSKLAKEMAQLLGNDAEIIAKPIGPSDQRKVKKISRYMTWLVFDAMRLPNEMTIFDFRRILFGRSHAYCPWRRDTFWVPMKDGTMAEDVSFEGPGFETLWPDDILVPAEDVRSLQEFSYVIRKYRATPDQLLRGEASGQYQGITDDYNEIAHFATHKRQRDFESELVKREKDYAEGVSYEGNLSGANTMIIHEWHGRWRQLKGKQDGAVDNLARRTKYESDLMIRYIPDLHKIIGCQDLAKMYPRCPNRRPFVEGALVRDGSYWGPGFGELLESIEDELSANHNLMTSAGELSVGPLIIYKPGMGFDPANFQYSPRQAIASDNPDLIKMVEFKANLEYPLAKETSMITYAERVTGITDMNIGRSQDQPNAPRTARGTLALLSEGDVRAELETSGLREDWAVILSRFWELTTMYAPEQEFFRVTEQHADGLFDVKNGGAWMTSEERGDRYDFDIRFATNAWSKEANKQDELQLYGLSLQNPLIIQNPLALWKATDRLHKAFGDDRFCDLVPEPPDPGFPIDPSEEDARMQEGEEVHVNPQDNDQAHIVEHSQTIQEMVVDPEANQEALNAIIAHRLAHMDQIARKQMMAELAQQLAAKIQAHVAHGHTLYGQAAQQQPGPGGQPQQGAPQQQGPKGAPQGQPPQAPGPLPGMPPVPTGGPMPRPPMPGGM